MRLPHRPQTHILDHGSTFNLHSRIAAAAPVIAQRVEGVGEEKKVGERVSG